MASSFWPKYAEESMQKVLETNPSYNLINFLVWDVFVVFISNLMKKE